jgi:UDP-N-acetylmuramoyl-tripeptide--D-alanyl-D-alanine ligase
MTPPKGGRRIAVLGDMLELGDDATRLHTELAQPLIDAEVNLVFTAGPGMRHLYDSLPKRMRGGHAASAAALADIAVRRLRPGDIVSVKGSHGSRMGEVVKRLLAGEPAPVPAKG